MLTAVRFIQKLEWKTPAWITRLGQILSSWVAMVGVVITNLLDGLAGLCVRGLQWVVFEHHCAWDEVGPWGRFANEDFHKGVPAGCRKCHLVRAELTNHNVSTHKPTVSYLAYIIVAALVVLLFTMITKQNR